MTAKVINERSIRKWLRRRGYHLIKLNGLLSGYMVTNSDRFVVYGSQTWPVSLEDVSAWIDEHKGNEEGKNV